MKATHVRPCIVDGCTHMTATTHVCNMHYLRYRKYGTYEPQPQIVLVDRFWANVDRSGGPDACWPWVRAVSSANGYGVVRVAGKIQRAHRIAWELANERPIPDGLLVCHRCDNRPCCNPAHLFVGTQSDNIRDMFAKGRDRQRHPRGENHHNSKLNDEAVRDIRRRVATGGVTRQALADEYGVSTSTIVLVVKREVWKHVI